MRIRIEGHELPGRDLPGHRNVHVGVQRRERPAELLDLQPGDAAMATWTLDCSAASVIDGCLDVRGSELRHLSPDGTTTHVPSGFRSIEEYARHMGHVDLLRERIDGRIGQ